MQLDWFLGTCMSLPRFTGRKQMIFSYISMGSFGMHYASRFSLELVGYTNSNWVGDRNDHKSTLGYVLYLIS
jgi:hypothetical protein